MKLITLSAIVASLAVPQVASAQAPRWWADVQALAHDSMRGRNAGSPEHRKAAEYVAAAFRAAGLKPAGTDGYFQPVRLFERTLDERQSSLALIRAEESERLTLGEDATLNFRAPLAPSFEAPVVFVGYGLDVPQYGYDDLAGADLRGKIVAYINGTPKRVPGPVLSHLRNQAWPRFRARGAVGLITFSSPRGGDTSWARISRGRLNAQMALADSMHETMRGNQLSLQWNAQRAEKLFAGAPERFAAIAARADSGLPLPHFDLAVRLRSTVAMRERQITSENVVGILPGTDPRLRNEYVVLSAHLDHVGVGRAVDGDSIYNGAMDNASGVALLMNAARQLASNRTGFKRSIVFAAVTAEEKGLLGSRYYSFNPTVPAGAIVANINTDMFLPIIPLKMIMVNGLEESDLADDAHRAGQASGLPVVTDPEPEENRFVRSDQYSFILRGVPSLSIKVGFTRDSPEHATIKDFRGKRYHYPADDLEQPVNFEAAAGFERFYLALVKEVANRETRPAWYQSSFFRRIGG